MRKILAALAAWLVMSPAMALAAPLSSHITRVEVKSAVQEGDRARITGVVHGVVDSAEAVVGLGALPKGPDGRYAYAANFEVVAPAPGRPRDQVVYIDAENRGGPISQNALGEMLKARRATYARVQWQTGFAAGVPETAQGVGLVIMRDFARHLAGRTPQTRTEGHLPLQTYDRLILGGISQSAWFVNTFIAEGFNVDPLTKNEVFDAAIAVAGGGGWLAINNLGAAAGAPQSPYVTPNFKPLTRRELLKRPRSDPFYVDIANYTDFYRLRAGITSTRASTHNFRRYDFPAAHVSGRGLTNPRCNNGERIQQNPIGYQPYMRAIVLGIMKEIGVDSARRATRLPRSRVFTLSKIQPPASPNFNPLPGVFTPVPEVNADGWPVGGVRFPDAELPLGRPVPAAAAPAVTTSINETCGNSGGFQPFGKAELDRRYGSREQYLALYGAQIDGLVRQGFLLGEDRGAMLQNAAELYDLWP